MSSVVDLADLENAEKQPTSTDEYVITSQFKEQLQSQEHSESDDQPPALSGESFEEIPQASPNLAPTVVHDFQSSQSESSEDEVEREPVEVKHIEPAYEEKPYEPEVREFKKGKKFVSQTECPNLKAMARNEWNMDFVPIIGSVSTDAKKGIIKLDVNLSGDEMIQGDVQQWYEWFETQTVIYQAALIPPK